MLLEYYISKKAKIIRLANHFKELEKVKKKKQEQNFEQYYKNSEFKWNMNLWLNW